MSETLYQYLPVDRAMRVAAMHERLKKQIAAERAYFGADGASDAVINTRISAARIAYNREVVKAREARKTQLAARRAAQDARSAEREAKAVRASVCQHCFTIHAGECI